MKTNREMSEEIFQEISRQNQIKEQRKKKILRASAVAVFVLMLFPGAIYLSTGSEMKNHTPLKIDWKLFPKDHEEDDSAKEMQNTSIVIYK